MENEIIAIDGFVIGKIYKNTSLSDMTGETWKDVVGYEGKYMVSSLGRVKSLDYRHTGKEGILEQGEVRGYLQVALCKNGKIKHPLVHRLVAEAFIPNPNNLPEVNHINECKTDNRKCNLNYMTSHENHVHGTGMRRMLDSRTGLNKEKPVLCVETGLIYPSAHEAERQTGTHNSNIVACCKGKLKTTGGYHWKYAD